MKIAVVGTGYVGLVTGTCFAETGNQVICVDIDKSKVDKLSNGQITIYEPGLEKIFLRNLKEGRLHFTTNLAEGVKDATIVFLALPTPPGEDGSADLKYILGVADDLGKILNDYKVIVDKSTVPVGTADKVQAAERDKARLLALVKGEIVGEADYEEAKDRLETLRQSQGGNKDGSGSSGGEPDEIMVLQSAWRMADERHQLNLQHIQNEYSAKS